MVGIQILTLLYSLVAKNYHRCDSFYYTYLNFQHFLAGGVGKRLYNEGWVYFFEIIYWKSILTFFTEGSKNIVILKDGWTAISDDKSRAAQFEHTVLITDTGVEILTQWRKQQFYQKMNSFLSNIFMSRATVTIVMLDNPWIFLTAQWMVCASNGYVVEIWKMNIWIIAASK